jgi:hypothetical protein
MISRLILVLVGLTALVSGSSDAHTKRELSTIPTRVHDLFVKHFPGGMEAFQEAIRERSDWSPLQLLEYSRVERWDDGWGRFKAMGPVIQCPSAIFESFGQGDGEKRICGSMKDDDCVVMSIGSHNEWDFEEAVIAKYPNCRIHTMDCYVQGTVPVAIKSQVTFHPICLGVEDAVVAGHRFMTWLSVVKEIGLTKSPTAMKMDIEGFEWTAIPAIIKSNVHVPESFSFELHYDTSINEVTWKGRRRTDPEIGLFMELLYSLGYVLVDRHDNERCGSCSEIVTAKLLPNTRFLHHSSALLQSNFASNTSHPNILKVDPFPTLPH